jgi:hypothetical protein
MKKIYLLITVLLFSLSSLFAQKQKMPDSVEISILQNEVNPPFLMGSAEIFSGNINRYNFSFNTGMGFKGMVGRIYASTDWEYNYLDGMAEVAMWNFAQKGFSVYQPQLSRNGSVLLGFAVHQKTKEEDISFVVKSTGGVDYYTKVPGKISKKIMIEGAYTRGFTWYGIDGLTGKGVNLSENSTDIVNFNSDGVSTMMDYSYFALGGSMVEYTNMTIDIAKFGRRSTQIFTRVYAHVLVGMKNEIDDVYITKELPGIPSGNTTYYQRYRINESMEKSNLGFRAGYDVDFIQGIGFGGTLEAGLFPGRTSDDKIWGNFYVLWKSRISLSKILGVK